ncbi:MAG: phosphatidylserine decarboxylase [bacterium]
MPDISSVVEVGVKGLLGLGFGVLLSNLKKVPAALTLLVLGLYLLARDFHAGAPMLSLWGDGFFWGVAAGFGYWQALLLLRDARDKPFRTVADPRKPLFEDPPSSGKGEVVSLKREGTESRCYDSVLERDGFPRSFVWSVDPPRGLSPFLKIFYKIFDPIRFSLFMGRMARASFSRFVVPFFAKRNGIDLGQFVNSEGREDFRSFDEFFTRRFKRLPPFFVGAAPCEGKVIYMARGRPDRALLIKGETISLRDLLGTAHPLPERLSVIITYLSPRDYHLGHSPVEGTVISKRRIPGLAWTVEPSIWKERNVEGLPGAQYLSFNARDVLVKQTPYGLLATVYVAATNVYSTEVHSKLGETVGAGSHEQSYHFGSTNVYVFDADRYDFPHDMHPGQQLQFGRTPFMIPRGV